jgi:hypothetical protein
MNEQNKELVMLVCGVANLSYLLHLIAVCIPEYQKCDGLAYNGGVSVALSCIVSQCIAIVAIVVILYIVVNNFCIKYTRR